MKISKKYQTIDREEMLLKYLLSLDLDEKNEVMFGINRYKMISQFTPEQVIQTLVALQDRELISIYFYGQPTCKSPCRITLREAGLTYFEDQHLEDAIENDTRWKDFLSGLGVGIVLLIIENIIRELAT